MLIHNQLAEHGVISADENAPFTVSISIHEWLSRARVVFIDYHGLRNSDKTVMITRAHLEELLTFIVYDIGCLCPPYSKKD